MLVEIARVKPRQALYQCSCGTQFKAFISNVSRGHTKSCGCFRRQATKDRSTTHGHKVGRHGSPTYVVWMNMRARCYNPNTKSYRDYGARGIRVCERWHKFENFLADMGEVQPGMTIERSDNDRDYSPSNCRWATRKEQARNKRNVRLLTMDGLTMTAPEWGIKLGINRFTLGARMRAGLSDEEVLTKKLHSKPSKTT
jgi:hypothetical protein